MEFIRPCATNTMDPYFMSHVVLEFNAVISLPAQSKLFWPDAEAISTLQKPSHI